MPPSNSVWPQYYLPDMKMDNVPILAPEGANIIISKHSKVTRTAGNENDRVDKSRIVIDAPSKAPDSKKVDVMGHQPSTTHR